MVVKAMGSFDKGQSSYGLSVHDAILFVDLFSELSYSHTKRNGNRIAHNLARLAMTMPECTVWMEDVPSRTLLFVQADLAVFS